MTLMLFLSVAAASVYHAVRMVWVFFTPNMKFIGGAIGLFIILCVNIALLCALIALRIYKPEICEKKAFKICKIVAYVLTSLSVVAAALNKLFRTS